MWLSTESELVPTPASQVWEVISDVTRLPEWHHFFASVTMDDAPERQSRGHGHYVPHGWFRRVHARTSGEFTASIGDRSVILRQPQPGRGEQIFAWWVADTADGATQITQRVRVTGFLSPVFERLSGRRSAADFADDVGRLADLCTD
jgi:hypothetical protein